VCCRFGALLEFYHRCGGPGWARAKGWALATRPVGAWSGVTTARDSRASNAVSAARLSKAYAAAGRSRADPAPVPVPPAATQPLRVCGLALGHNGLAAARVPWEALSELRAITSLNLSRNALRGRLPSSPLQTLELGSGFERCARLDLSHNLLTGPLLPAWVASLSCLEALCLSGNQLTGPLPWGALSELPALKVLSLDHNDWSGPLPETLDG
jgi:hypothetical protein